MYGDVFIFVILIVCNGLGYIYGIYIFENVVCNIVDFVVNICDLFVCKVLFKYEFCNVW